MIAITSKSPVTCPKVSRPTNLPLARIDTVAETASTNADMLLRAGEGGQEGEWLRAERQSAGRGRMGRAWQSPPGNLYTSTIVRLQPGDPTPATLTLLAAVALFDWLRALGVDCDLIIKWPNDLLVGSAKIAGILLERTGDAVVIGFGVNLAHAPEGLERPVTSLAACGLAIAPADALAVLADGFVVRVAEWRSSLATIIAAWEAAAHPRGTPLRVATSDNNHIDGSFDGLGPDGALRLRLADGSIRAIHAGDVFLV